MEAGVLTKMDSHSIRTYCQITNINRIAYSEIERLGITITNPETGFIHTNPSVQIYKETNAQLISLMGAFGFTPKARQTLKAKKPEPKKASIFELLN